ncbi:tRNA (adenosine(37)-N6)-dimethylallyltransferase MiaA [Kiritimatiellaeota bacterium B1221]|nr:tRNA (adenosine(37)-N6)-dimethylallyltransferase MiaA [Kiritimatiellaeota bacterium B1221]
MSATTPLYLLSGPTASGKTTIAHILADRMNLRLLSVDSMMVYQGMDIGTAKPSAEEIQKYHYAGVNLVPPGEQFSTGKWIRHISAQLDERPTLAVGGTGLYFRAIIDGLPPENNTASPAPPQSVQAMQSRIHELDPDALRTLADPQNPRRLERALAWLENSQPLPQTWKERSGFPIAVLRRPTEELNQRILQRIVEMFEQGLLDETRNLLAHGKPEGTASQAIGYKEAQAVLDNKWDLNQAIEELSTRTRRYAKRQRTWFRNQMEARWVDVENSANPELIADKVAGIWQETGPYLFDRSPYVRNAS